MARNNLSFKILAFVLVFTIFILGMFAFAMNTKSKGIYSEKRIGDLNIKTYNIYQYLKDTQSIENAKEILFEIENTNTAKDYNLKLYYEFEGKNETILLEVPAGRTQKASLKVFSKTDINGLEIYSKTITIKSGDVIINEEEVKLNVGKVEIYKSSGLRTPQIFIANAIDNNFIVWLNIDDTKTLSDIKVIDTNTSKITITSTSYEEEELNSNKWAKITLSYQPKGSVLKDAYYKEGFSALITAIYDNINITNPIKEDFIHTQVLDDYLTLQKDTFNELAKVN